MSAAGGDPLAFADHLGETEAVIGGRDLLVPEVSEVEFRPLIVGRNDSEGMPRYWLGVSSSLRNRDSGVVIRMSGGCRVIR